MLKISHIAKTFNPGTVNEKKAIEDLSLELKKGDFATIIGSNGAGKSTLFNAVCGDFMTDAGAIELDGRDITFMPQHVRAKEIGRLYQDPMRGTAPGMTIEENLALAAAVAELADALDSKSSGKPCRFESGQRHSKSLEFSRLFSFVRTFVRTT